MGVALVHPPLLDPLPSSPAFEKALILGREARRRFILVPARFCSLNEVHRFEFFFLFLPPCSAYLTPTSFPSFWRTVSLPYYMFYYRKFNSFLFENFTFTEFPPLATSVVLTDISSQTRGNATCIKYFRPHFYFLHRTTLRSLPSSLIYSFPSAWASCAPKTIRLGWC